MLINLISCLNYTNLRHNFFLNSTSHLKSSHKKFSKFTNIMNRLVKYLFSLLDSYSCNKSNGHIQ